MMADLEFWKGGFQYVIKVHVALLGGGGGGGGGGLGASPQKSFGFLTS